MGLFSLFGAGRQERQELQALVQVSHIIMERIGSSARNALFSGNSLRFPLEQQEIAALSAGLDSKSAHPRDRALQLLENVANLSEIEDKIVIALMQTEDEQIKLKCLKHVIPLINQHKAVAVYSRTAHNSDETVHTRTLSARQLALNFTKHPDGADLLANLLSHKTPSNVIRPALEALLTCKLDNKILLAIKGLRNHPDIQTVSDIFHFLSLHPRASCDFAKTNYVSEFADSDKGEVFRAQIHAGLASDNINQKIAACALIVKNPKVAANTLPRLIAIYKGILSTHITVSSHLYQFNNSELEIASQFDPSKISFPTPSLQRLQITSSQRLWIHALGYSATLEGYDQEAFQLLQDSFIVRHLSNVLSNHDHEIYNLTRAWRYLLAACKDSDALHDELAQSMITKRSTIDSTQSDNANIFHKTLRATCEIANWTGPMELECVPAFCKCLLSEHAEIRALAMTILAGIGHKIKDLKQLLPILPKSDNVKEKQFISLIHAYAAPNNAATTSLIKEALMDNAPEISRVAIIAARQIGANAASLRGELTLLALSDDEITSRLARSTLSNIGVDIGNKQPNDFGNEDFFSLKLAG